jgi:hypothetical protein
MFVGGKVVEAIELEARQVDLEARLLENENLVHHFQSVIRNRDQELNSTKRVSTHTLTHTQQIHRHTHTYTHTHTRTHAYIHIDTHCKI